MENIHKKMLKELDDLIARAPDVDIEQEYVQFCETHEASLWDMKMHISGLMQRMMLIMELIRFQKNFVLGGDVSEILHKIFNYAKILGKESIVNNFSSEARMHQMAKILEHKGVEMLCEQAKRRRKQA